MEPLAFEVVLDATLSDIDPTTRSMQIMLQPSSANKIVTDPGTSNESTAYTFRNITFTFPPEAEEEEEEDWPEMETCLPEDELCSDQGAPSNTGQPYPNSRGDAAPSNGSSKWRYHLERGGSEIPDCAAEE